MKYIQTQISHVNDFLGLHGLLPGYIFRGQANSEWNLTTSLERALGNKLSQVHHLKDVELPMLKRFMQRRHLYASTYLNESDIFEWLAELQHYGAPTRLLDFSFSVYIATHFATHNTSSDCSVWAVNIRNTLNYFNKNHGTQTPNGRHLLNKEMQSKSWNISSKHVVILESNIPNIRMIKQQGLFLAQICTRDINGLVSFEDCLASTFEANKMLPPEIVKFEEFAKNQSILLPPDVVKINIPKHILPELRGHLECMGITTESLFPGLDGLASSLLESSQRAESTGNEK